ncbi:transposase family protein [Streptomyces sp. NPDC059766]|uniref:transposase family protein n=1 Tax=Streptomyces sp. NPDC059766 TaxID=3346940 RepID=UPI003667B8DD
MRPGRCPNCRKQARRVHGTYQRTLEKRLLGSHRVIVRLRVRRYCCDRSSCSRTTLVGQVPGLSARYRRSSTGLAAWLRLTVPARRCGVGPGSKVRVIDHASGRRTGAPGHFLPAVPSAASLLIRGPGRPLGAPHGSSSSAFSRLGLVWPAPDWTASIRPERPSPKS